MLGRCTLARSISAQGKACRRALNVQCAAVKLHYFKLPARGEASKLMLLIGGVDYEFVGWERDAWQQFKPSTPYGQLPLLEVDGKLLAQSSAIERYVAKMVGMYPADPWQAALSDEWAATAEDLLQLFAATFRLPTNEEKVKARQEIIATTFAAKMKAMEARLGDKPFITGDQPVAGDITVYCTMCTLTSGFIDGIAPTVYESFPVIRAYRNRVANLEAVRKHYAGETEGLRMSFKPDA